MAIVHASGAYDKLLNAPSSLLVVSGAQWRTNLRPRERDWVTGITLETQASFPPINIWDQWSISAVAGRPESKESYDYDVLLTAQGF